MMTIIGDRQTGKTAFLIRLSSNTGHPILASTVGRAANIELQARKMNLQIPPVLSISAMPSRGLLAPGENVIVDELGQVAEHLLGVRCFAASVHGVMVEPETINLAKLGIWQLFKLWRSARKRVQSGGEDA